jgi:hypothetical protein
MTESVLLEKRRKVIDLKQRGMTVSEISRLVDLGRPAVRYAIGLYAEGEDAALVPAKRGKKQDQGRVLSAEWESKIFDQICNQQPWQNKKNVASKDKRNWDHAMWDRRLVNRLVANIANVEMKERLIAKYSERWGFKLPNIRAPKECCTGAVQAWLNQHYAEIEQCANNENAEILWLNKTPLKHIDPSKSKTKLWMISAVNRTGKIQWLVVKTAFTVERQTIILNALIKFKRRKVFVILQDTALFNLQELTKWIETKRDKIEVFPDQSSTVPVK